MLTESAAIARFLARRHGLVGRDDFEAALIDAAVDTMSDLYPGLCRLSCFITLRWVGCVLFFVKTFS